MAAVRAMGDVIIKPIFGSMGHGIVRVSDPEVAFRVVRPARTDGSVFYVQRAIDHGGRDIRAFVVGGRVIGAIERQAPPGDWRTNVAIGGSATSRDDLSAKWSFGARAAAAVGADYAGVDVLPARDGRDYVLEVNGIPGWQGLQHGNGHRRGVGDRRARRAMRASRDGHRTSRGASACMSGVYRELAAALLAVDRDHRPLNVGLAAQLACLLEVSAPKPGNVSPGRHFADLRYEDFLASALAIGEPMAAAGERGVGATVRLAVEATARLTRSNTNLGIVLLFAPLARAASLMGSDPFTRLHSEGLTLRDAARQVLEATTIEDAIEAYAAIRLARPGGLDRAESQDVFTEPTMTLVEVMRLAAHRDTVASEYATGFEVTFGTAVPALERARRDGLPWDALSPLWLRAARRPTSASTMGGETEWRRARRK